MKETLTQAFQEIGEPVDYFRGVGRQAVAVPMEILLFARWSKQTLQQRALQNRSHHRFVLLINVETRGVVHVDHLAFPFAPGQGILIHPFQFHHFSRLAASRLFWCICTFELEDAAWLEPLRNRVVTVGEDARQGWSRLVQIWRANREGTSEPAFLRSTHLQAVLVELLVCLRRDGADSPALPPASSGDPLLGTIHRWLDEGQGSVPDTAVLARRMGYSESRLRALFREAAGVPLGRYIRNYRLNRAMALLRRTSRPIAEIAETTGFGSPQAFCRVFREATGTTPRAYRTGRADPAEPSSSR